MNKAIKARFARFWAAMRPWIELRLRQPSTYFGVVLKVAGLVGLPLTDSVAGQLAELLAVAAGAALVAWNQAPKADDTDKAGA